MRRASYFLLIGAALLVGIPAQAYWQSRASNYNQAVSSGCSPVSPPSGGIFDDPTLSGSTDVVNGSITLNSASSPDCLTNGATFVENTNNSTHYVPFGDAEITHSFSAASATIILYVKDGVGTRNSAIQMFDASFSFLSQVTVNPGSCSAAAAASTTFSGATATATFTPVGSWCEVSLNTNTITTTGVFIFLMSASGTTTGYTGDGTSSLLYWGAGLSSP